MKQTEFNEMLREVSVTKLFSKKLWESYRQAGANPLTEKQKLQIIDKVFETKTGIRAYVSAIIRGIKRSNRKLK